ncbi:MAG: hypothetical protein LN590_00810 [Rickettsia endosymbiont of Glossina mortisans submortisans]|nr:hypothetical protein [Rickettsia endosymbiont of Glossina mortisans submortisans]
MTHSKEDNQTVITFNDSFGYPINSILDDIIKNKVFENKTPPLVLDVQTKQQDNNYDCGPYSVETMIRKANGKPILTESEAKDKGPELRAKHARLVIEKQQAQEMMHQVKTNPLQQSSNKFQNLINSQKTKDTERSR